MRPKSIVLFERLVLASILLGLVGAYLAWEHTQALLSAQNSPLGSSSVLVIQGITILLYLLLIYFIARRGSPVAKWIYVVLAGLGLVLGAVGIGQAFELGTLSGVISIVQLIITAATLWLLFRPDSKAWFSEGRGEVDVETFR